MVRVAPPPEILQVVWADPVPPAFWAKTLYVVVCDGFTVILPLFVVGFQELSLGVDCPKTFVIVEELVHAHVNVNGPLPDWDSDTLGGLIVPPPLDGKPGQLPVYVPLRVLLLTVPLKVNLFPQIAAPAIPPFEGCGSCCALFAEVFAPFWPQFPPSPPLEPAVVSTPSSL